MPQQSVVFVLDRCDDDIQAAAAATAAAIQAGDNNVLVPNVCC
jgi:hypothetical protein